MLWDSSGWGPFERDELQRVVAATAPAPLIALLDFPRWHECEQIIAAGATAVVAKPFRLDELAWQLEQVVPPKTENVMAGPHYNVRNDTPIRDPDRRTQS